MTGIALPLYELPTALLEHPAVRARVHERHGAPEVQFHWWQSPTFLPVRWCGRIQLARWGSKARAGTPLPYGGWVAQDQIAAGSFAAAAPELVVIPAVLGFDRGTWFVIDEGVRGVVVRDRSGPVVYVLTRPATNYYRNMTRQTPTMPVLVGQVI
ncbi:MAG TPA: hypothetical protein VM597_38655 [Gemmataceae bacterium]|jgi:hypothetical protein|nr:hypothetical protein [Gemmataceae bacterium]